MNAVYAVGRWSKLRYAAHNCTFFKSCKWPVGSMLVSPDIHDALLRSVSYNTGEGLPQPLIRYFNSLKPELNPSAQSCLTRFFTGDFSSLTLHFVHICVKNQQIHQVFIRFINYVWYLLHVSALQCHPQGAFLVPSERCSIEEQSIEYRGWACCV
jgi:hypothetical protein